MCIRDRYEAADKGADRIITAGDFIDNMVTVAEEYPEISFLMVNEKMEEMCIRDSL